MFSCCIMLTVSHSLIPYFNTWRVVLLDIGDCCSILLTTIAKSHNWYQGFTYMLTLLIIQLSRCLCAV